MFDILDILDRSAAGEPMAASDWDFDVAMATRRLVKKHGLDWDRTRVINDDPARREPRPAVRSGLRSDDAAPHAGVASHLRAGEG